MLDTRYWMLDPRLMVILNGVKFTCEGLTIHHSRFTIQDSRFTNTFAECMANF